MSPKIYSIEERVKDHLVEYRFRSLVNSCKGQWYVYKHEAVAEGACHAKLVETLMEVGKLSL